MQGACAAFVASSRNVSVLKSRRVWMPVRVVIQLSLVSRKPASMSLEISFWGSALPVPMIFI